MKYRLSILFSFFLVSKSLFAFSMYSGNQPSNSGADSVTWKTSCHFVYEGEVKGSWVELRENREHGKCVFEGECVLKTFVDTDTEEDCKLGLSADSQIEWDATQKAAKHLCNAGSFDPPKRTVKVEKERTQGEMPCKEKYSSSEIEAIVKKECHTLYNKKNGKLHPEQTIWGRTIVSELECESGRQQPLQCATP